MKLLDRLFKPIVIYKIVEVEKPKPVIEDNEEILKSVASLATHPGFEYLNNKLKLQRALLKSRIDSDRHAELKDVEFIQSGIFWCSWLDTQVRQALYTVSRPKLVATLPVEEELFKQMSANLAEVGKQV